MMLFIVVPILLATLLSVAGWLIKRNEDQHESLASDVQDLKVGQARMDAKLDILLEDRKDG